MNWFNTKKQHSEVDKYLFYKELEYKNNIICVWANKFEHSFNLWPIGFLFEAGWNIKNGYGQYNTGIAPDDLQNNLTRQIESAKKYIDNKLNEPSDIKRALDSVKNIHL